MAKARDYQRMLVYAAETEAAKIYYGTRYEWPYQRPMPESEARAFFDKIITSRWWKERQGNLPTPQLRIHNNMVRATAGLDDFVIRSSPNILTQWILCHELAHLLVGYDLKNKKLKWDETPYHGPEFVQKYLGIIKRFMGQYAYYTWKNFFTQSEVNY